ncbi:hypothetical protein [Neisseria iguanae]|uniref:Uncharacterized protein n=1 Tax=Neisseria iguanae TaxID=90242 RepID=A0A2P7U030_9NEIS|nr:hypothetical protein [Neisseria iguanae]PSJ80324.1 hypothetical protein C7N83_07015 [Neisseria iguanae]
MPFKKAWEDTGKPKAIIWILLGIAMIFSSSFYHSLLSISVLLFLLTWLGIFSYIGTLFKFKKANHWVSQISEFLLDMIAVFSFAFIFNLVLLTVIELFRNDFQTVLIEATVLFSIGIFFLGIYYSFIFWIREDFDINKLIQYQKENSKYQFTRNHAAKFVHLTVLIFLFSSGFFSYKENQKAQQDNNILKICKISGESPKQINCDESKGYIIHKFIPEG